MSSAGLSTLPVFVSISMAVPVDDTEEEDHKTSETYVPFIKNTFIDVFDDYLASITVPQKRRSCSAPPSHRAPCAAAARNEFIHEAMTKIPCSPASLCACSLASTSAKEDSEDEITSTLGLLDDGSSEDDSVQSAPEPESPPSRDVVPLRLSDLLPARAALSSKSNPWLTSGLRSLPKEVRLSFAEIAAACQSSLMASSGMKSVQISELPGGLSLIGSVDGDRCGDANGVLDLAGQAMLAKALESESIYVVGYERDPFKPLQEGFGFCAQLAMVYDENLACWDLLAKGACSRGCFCKWQHPTIHMAINVSLDFVTPSMQ